MSELVLRYLVIILVAANLVWTVPLSWRSLKGPVAGWPNAGFSIPLSGLLLGLAGMQSTEILDLNPLLPLGFYVVALLLFKFIHISRLVEIEAVTGKVTGSLRLWRLLWRKG